MARGNSRRPSETPRTQTELPVGETPVEAVPVPAPAPAPAEVPAPVETPAETVPETPVEAPAVAPTPVEAPAPAPAPAPVEKVAEPVKVKPAPTPAPAPASVKGAPRLVPSDSIVTLVYWSGSARGGAVIPATPESVASAWASARGTVSPAQFARNACDVLGAPYKEVFRGYRLNSVVRPVFSGARYVELR